MRKFTKKMTAWMMVAAMVAPLSFSNPVVAHASETESSVEVTIRTQAFGGYLRGFETTDVASNLAESYGYEDKVDGVSALDVLVKAHESIFEEEFTKETASEYLAVSESGWVSKIFGAASSSNGFLVNGSVANDGEENEDENGEVFYTGTMINETAIEDGDVLDFFIYQDYWAMDSLSYVDFDSHLVAGKEVDYTAYGIMVGWEGYKYADAEELYDASEELEGVKLALVNAESGEVTPLDGDTTDEDGEGTFVAPKEPGDYYITVYSDDEDIPVIMNPVEVTFTKEAVHDEDDLSLENDSKATCTQTGYTGDLVCDICEEIVEKGEVIPMAPHKLIHEEGVAATCTKEGKKENWKCSVCKDYFLTEDAKEKVTADDLVLAVDPNNHVNVESIEGVAATCDKDGKTEGKHCLDCDKIAVEQEVIKAAHKWDAGKVTKEATVDAEGEKTYTCEVCKATKTEAISKKEASNTETPNVPAKENVEVGTVVNDAQSNAQYKVTDVAKKTVTYVAPADAKATTIIVPATIKVNGVDYKVTKIADNAFKGNKKIKKVTIGKNITTIGNKAFYKCTSLTSITIPASVTKIGKSAFEGCKKLKKITIKTTKLTTKKVGSKAFKGIAAKAKVKVPKKKLNAYKKMLKKKGLPKKATVKK